MRQGVERQPPVLLGGTVAPTEGGITTRDFAYGQGKEDGRNREQDSAQVKVLKHGFP